MSAHSNTQAKPIDRPESQNFNRMRMEWLDRP